MASRIRQWVMKRFGPKLYAVGATFYPQGSSNTAMTVAAGTLKTDGGVTSVVQTSDGIFTVTLDDHYDHVVSHSASVRLATQADLKVQFGAFTMGSGTTPTSFVLRTIAVNTATAIAANSNSSVSFYVEFGDTSVRS